MLFFFFFSSRRRHTRYWRDWSSDVCSSDLPVRPRSRVRRRPAARGLCRAGLAAWKRPQTPARPAPGRGRTGGCRGGVWGWERGGVGKRGEFGGGPVIKKKKKTGWGEGCSNE